MSKKVTVFTTATNPDTGEVVNLKPGDVAPEWAKLGEHVYAEPEGQLPEEPVAGPGQSMTRAKALELGRQAAADNAEAEDLMGDAAKTEAAKKAAEAEDLMGDAAKTEAAKKAAEAAAKKQG